MVMMSPEEILTIVQGRHRQSLLVGNYSHLYKKMNLFAVTRYPFSAFLPPSVSPPPGIYYRKENSSIVGEQTTGHVIGVSVSPPPGFDEAVNYVSIFNDILLEDKRG